MGVPQRKYEPTLLKPTGTIHIATEFSLVERKLLNALMFSAQRGGTTGAEQVVSVRELMGLIGFTDSNNDTAIKEGLKKLISTLITWNVFGADRVKEWGACTFLSSSRIRSGRLYYRVNPQIADQVNSPTLFAKLQMLVQTRVQKKHTLPLYEFLIDYLCRTQSDKYETPDIDLGRFYTIMGFGPEGYSGAYKFFKRDILKPSLKEINSQTDISVEMKEIRARRSIAALRFMIERKASVQLPLKLDPTEEEVIASAEIVSLLTEQGVSEKKARIIAQTHDAERIRENIAFVEHAVTQAKAKGKEISNRAAYLVRAIEEDYRPKKAPIEVKREQAAKERQEAAAAKAAKEAHQKRTEEAFKSYRDVRAEELYESQPESWKQEKLHSFEAFMDEQRDAGKGGLLQRQYQLQGLKSPLVRAIFMSRLTDELLTRPEERDLQAFAAWQAEKGRGAAHVQAAE